MARKRNALCLVCTVAGLALSAFAGADKANNSKAESNVAMKAFNLRMEGRVDEAKVMLEKAVAQNPDDAPAQFELARDYFYTLMDHTDEETMELKQKQKAMKDQLNRARKAIKKAVKAEPTNPRYHYWAAVIATYKAIFDAHSVLTIVGLPFEANNSIKSYEKALKLKPDYHQARQELMGLYDRLPWYCGGNKSKAEKHAKKLEQTDPIYAARARCEIRPRKEPPEKIAIWKNIVIKLPNNAKAHVGLAAEYINANDFKKAVEHLDKAVEHLDTTIDSGHSYNLKLLDLSRRYCRAEAYDKAQKVLSRFDELESPPPTVMRAWVLRQLADINRNQGNEQAAEAFEQEADKLDSTNWPEFRWMPPGDFYTPPCKEIPAKETVK